MSTMSMWRVRSQGTVSMWRTRSVTTVSMWRKKPLSSVDNYEGKCHETVSMRGETSLNSVQLEDYLVAMFLDLKIMSTAPGHLKPNI